MFRTIIGKKIQYGRGCMTFKVNSGGDCHRISPYAGEETGGVSKRRGTLTRGKITKVQQLSQNTKEGKKKHKWKWAVRGDLDKLNQWVAKIQKKARGGVSCLS